MTNRVVIQRRLEKIRTYLGFLKDVAQRYDRVTFVREAMVHGSAERYLAREEMEIGSRRHAWRL